MHHDASRLQAYRGFLSGKFALRYAHVSRNIQEITMMKVDNEEMKEQSPSDL